MFYYFSRVSLLKVFVMKDKRYRKESVLECIHQNDVDVEERTIFLHSQQYYGDGDGTPSDESGVDWKMATKFMKNMHYLNNISSEPITIKMASCGGDYYFGMAIFDIIKQSAAPVDIYAYVHARSMTSIILQAARKRYISKNCIFMVHYGEYGDYGDLRKVESGLNFYVGHNKTMFDVYADRCVNGGFFAGQKHEQVVDYIQKKTDSKVDWWLHADEAVLYGFADEVF